MHVCMFVVLLTKIHVMAGGHILLLLLKLTFYQNQRLNYTLLGLVNAFLNVS